MVKKFRKKVANYLQIGNEWQKIVMKVCATCKIYNRKKRHEKSIRNMKKIV